MEALLLGKIITSAFQGFLVPILLFSIWLDDSTKRTCGRRVRRTGLHDGLLYLHVCTYAKVYNSEDGTRKIVQSLHFLPIKVKDFGAFCTVVTEFFEAPVVPKQKIRGKK